MKEKGYRWAPSTFLGQSEEKIFQDLDMKSFSEREDDQSTQLTDRGLLLQCAGIMLNRWDGSIGKGFWVRDDNEMWCYVTRKYSHIGHQVLQPGKHLDESSQNRALALLTKASLDQSFAGPKSQGAFTGVLVSYYEHDEEADVLFASVEDVVFILRMDAIDSKEKDMVLRLTRDCDQLLQRRVPEGSEKLGTETVSDDEFSEGPGIGEEESSGHVHSSNS
jgi:hypothetical protein